MVINTNFVNILTFFIYKIMIAIFYFILMFKIVSIISLNKNILIEILNYNNISINTIKTNIF